LNEIVDPACSGDAIATSTDGRFVGVVQLADGTYKEYDLMDWIEEHYPDLADGNPSQDVDYYFDILIGWQEECEWEFIGHFEDSI